MKSRGSCTRAHLRAGTGLMVALLACVAACAPRVGGLRTLARPSAPGASSATSKGAGGGAFAMQLRSSLQCEEGTTIAVRPHPEGLLRCCVDGAGRRHGAWVVYSRDGHRLMERRYHEDKKHGPARGYFANGQVHAVGVYENDRRQGLWHFWNDAGMPSVDILYYAGEKVEERKPATP